MRLFALLLFAMTICCGCAQRYKITLQNHQTMMTSSRPKLDKATQTYRFKDSSGRPVILPSFRVREIEPL
jgi:ABC-type Fe3+-hydroxamate transport system substrate-binding protein